MKKRESTINCLVLQIDYKCRIFYLSPVEFLNRENCKHHFTMIMVSVLNVQCSDVNSQVQRFNVQRFRGYQLLVTTRLPST